MRYGLFAALLLVVLVGCVPAEEQSQASATATRFAADVASKDGTAACALLIEAARRSLESDSGQSCATSVVDVRTSSGAAQARVWGDEAEVRMGHDTLFLDHTHAGWRIRAAGCSPQGDGQPYDCEVAP